jgi:multicomponent Na+:H+ antiporter subunit E
MGRRFMFRHPGTFVVRATLFSLVWLVLVGPDLASWIIGAPVVVAASLASIRLSAPENGSPSALGLIRFVPYFLWESLRGAADVAARVMLPRVRVRPGTHAYPMRLRDPSARVVFIDSISLVPGTLSADLHGDVVTVHALDIESDLDTSLQDLERRVARVFGDTLHPGPTEPRSLGRSSTEIRPTPERPE